MKINFANFYFCHFYTDKFCLYKINFINIFFILLLSLNFDRKLSDVRHVNILLNNLNNINKC